MQISCSFLTELQSCETHLLNLNSWYSEENKIPLNICRALFPRFQHDKNNNKKAERSYFWVHYITNWFCSFSICRKKEKIGFCSKKLKKSAH